ncbi:thaumatin [Scleroderma citrinum]
MIIIILVAEALARSVTVSNLCSFTIWPAMFTAIGTPPSYPTGWEAASGTTVSFTVPENWSSARIWGRRNCNFTHNSGTNNCLDGGCNGGLQCNGIGAPPATLAEFTLNPNGQDYYDISLVDGYNLPVSITSNAGCPVADCPIDLGPSCPIPLRGPIDSAGTTVGCLSACEANIDGNPSNSPNCCTGQYSTPATCPSSGVQYYNYFKSNCPNSYCYAYDESSGTALWTCDGSRGPAYTITFCPR